ncbi:hypothetical protein HK405_006018, partial [Cladochytrium tenue]
MPGTAGNAADVAVAVVTNASERLRKPRGGSASHAARVDSTPEEPRYHHQQQQSQRLDREEVERQERLDQLWEAEMAETERLVQEARMELAARSGGSPGSAGGGGGETDGRRAAIKDARKQRERERERERLERIAATAAVSPPGGAPPAAHAQPPPPQHSPVDMKKSQSARSGAARRAPAAATAGDPSRALSPPRVKSPPPVAASAAAAGLPAPNTGAHVGAVDGAIAPRGPTVSTTSVAAPVPRRSRAAGKPLIDVSDSKNCVVCGCSEFRSGYGNKNACSNWYVRARLT